MSSEPPIIQQIALALFMALGLSVAFYLLVSGQAWVLRANTPATKRRQLRLAIGMFLFVLIGMGGAMLARDLGFRPEQSGSP